MPDGTLFAAVFNISFDPVEEIRLYVNRQVEKVEILLPDGNREEVGFLPEGNNIFTVKTRADVLTPVILFIS